MAIKGLLELACCVNVLTWGHVDCTHTLNCPPQDKNVKVLQKKYQSSIIQQFKFLNSSKWQFSLKDACLDVCGGARFCLCHATWFKFPAQRYTAMRRQCVHRKTCTWIYISFRSSLLISLIKLFLGWKDFHKRRN